MALWQSACATGATVAGAGRTRDKEVQQTGVHFSGRWGVRWTLLLAALAAFPARSQEPQAAPPQQQQEFWIGVVWGGLGYRSLHVGSSTDSRLGYEGGFEVGTLISKTLGLVGVADLNVVAAADSSIIDFPWYEPSSRFNLYQLGVGLHFEAPVRFTVGPTLSVNVFGPSFGASTPDSRDARMSGGAFVHAWYPVGGSAHICLNARASLDGLTRGDALFSLTFGIGVSN